MNGGITIEDTNLTPKERKILAAVISQPTMAKAAAALDMSLKCVWRTMQKPHVKAEYERQSKELLQDASETGKKCLCGALEELSDIAHDKEESGQTRVQACRALLEYGLKLVDTADFDSRITALEERENLDE